MNGACSGKKHHPVARVMYTIEYEPTTMSGTVARDVLVVARVFWVVARGVLGGC